MVKLYNHYFSSLGGSGQVIPASAGASLSLGGIVTDDKRIRDRPFMRSIASSLIVKGLFEFIMSFFD